jgi:hypothetical protein
MRHPYGKRVAHVTRGHNLRSLNVVAGEAFHVDMVLHLIPIEAWRRTVFKSC